MQNNAVQSARHGLTEFEALFRVTLKALAQQETTQSASLRLVK
jgi:hypothetical protein